MAKARAATAVASAQAAAATTAAAACTAASEAAAAAEAEAEAVDADERAAAASAAAAAAAKAESSRTAAEKARGELMQKLESTRAILDTAAEVAAAETLAATSVSSAEVAAAKEQAAAARSELTRVLSATKKAIQSKGLSDAITRTQIKLIEHHGKGASDAESNVPKFGIASAIESGALLDPGTQQLARFMAEHRQAPSVDKSKKVP